MARCAEFSAAPWLHCGNNFARLSLQWSKSMATIHDEIDDWLAADLHGELSNNERSALHSHLLDCSACRKSHHETKLTDRILEETLAQEKPGPAFEQRMLAGFRKRVPQRSGFIKLLVDLMRLRATQIAAVAAVLLGLVQIGRMITGERLTEPPARDGYANIETAAAQPSEPRPSQAGALGRSDGIAAGRPQDLSVEASAPPPPSRSKFREESKAAAATVAAAKSAQAETAESDAFVAPENAAIGNEAAQTPPQTPAPVLSNQKLIRNATADLEIISFDSAVQKITAFANEERGYVATTDSEKQANGKLRGQVVVKVLPEKLDGFLQKIRSLGELKNQTLGTDDVTKAYFDTDARLKNAHVMEQRLIEILKTKTGKVSDLLQVEKELGRVREEIEKMQSELKYWDSQVQFATVTISLAEKDMLEPAAFLLRERAQLALYAPDVEKIYDESKSLASPKVQITNAQLTRDYSGRVSAQVSMLIAPDESDGVIGRIKGLGRVENFQTQSQRIAQGGNPASAGS